MRSIWRYPFFIISSRKLEFVGRYFRCGFTVHFWFVHWQQQHFECEDVVRRCHLIYSRKIWFFSSRSFRNYYYYSCEFICFHTARREAANRFVWMCESVCLWLCGGVCVCFIKLLHKTRCACFDSKRRWNRIYIQLKFIIIILKRHNSRQRVTIPVSEWRHVVVCRKTVWNV